jgi:signal transduction histidine kinase
MRLLLTFVLTFLTFLTYSASPSLKFYHLTHEQGLSQSTVNCIIKDYEGFFWFCTNNGLNKWDGYTIKHYFHDEHDSNSIGLGRANIIIEDEEKTLWIGTNQGGISKYVREYDRFVNYPIRHGISQENNNVTALVSFKGNLLVGTFNEGIYLFNKETAAYSPVKLIDENNNLIPSITDAKLYIDRNNSIWIAHTTGAFKIQKFKKKSSGLVATVRAYLSGENVLDIFQDRRGGIWFGTYESGAFRLNEITSQYLQLKSGKADSKHLNHSIVRRFNEDASGNIWIGTGGAGLNIYQPETGRIEYHTPQLGNKYALSSNIIYYIYADPDTNFWIGTYNGGVSYTNWYKQSFNHVRSFGSEGELNNNAILSFCETTDGKVWIGTDGGGINILNPETNRHAPIKHPLLSKAKVVTSMKTDSRGNIYIGTYRTGFFIYNLKTNKAKHYVKSMDNSVNSNDIWDIELSNDEKVVWLATLGGGLNKFIPSKDQFEYFLNDKNTKESLAEDYLSTLTVDSKNNLWIGTYHGGVCLLPGSKGNKFITFGKDSITGLTSNEIRVIFEDSNKRILIGVHDGGLNLFNPNTKTFTSYNRNQGLPGNTVQAILEDDFGYLWLSTNNGIAKLKFESDSIRVRNFNTIDGLQANEFNLHSALKCSSGVLYFGGINGYNAFHPADIIESKNTGDVVLTRMFIFDEEVLPGKKSSPIIKSLSYTDEVRLKHWQSTFTFEFALLDYNVPELNTYEYRLKGFDTEWMRTGSRRRATYTNIDPGSYSFEVRGINLHGISTENTVVLDIYLEPPFYQTPIFRLLVVISIVLLLLAIYRFRVRTLRIQGSLLKRMVDERTSELRSLNTVLETQNIEINQQSEELKKQKENLIEANTKLESSYHKIEHQNIELEKHRNNLEEIVRDRTNELEQAKRKAEESEQLKMAFLSNMSHEIRTPMNAIVGFASLLADEELRTQEKQEYIRQINMNSESLLILIDDILDLSKIEANQLLVKKSVFEVNAFINETYFNWELLKRRDNSKVGFKYHNQLSDKKIFVNSDELRLRQILNNLLDNAFKFTSQGQIELTVYRNGSDIVYTVSDTGIGIPEEDLGQIFNRFRKGEESGRKLYRGAGLGLTISNKLATMLDGRLWVESKKDMGSKFYLSVPIGEIAEAAIVEQDVKQIADNKNIDLSDLNILIAEDEETNYNYLRGILNKRGVKVSWAKNGEEAVRMVSVNDYNVVLMDIKMPVMDGLDATKKIKAMFPNQLIIAQTAFARPEEESEFRRVGFDDYISKPIKSNILVGIIAKHLTRD